MSENDLKKTLIERAFDLLYNHVPSNIDVWFKDELVKLTVENYFDDEFMDDWREQRRIYVYELIAKTKSEILQSFDTTARRKE